MFANNVLLFCRGDMRSVGILLEVFQNFSRSSALQVNVEKCEVYFPKVYEDIQQPISDTLGMKIRSLPFNYLGFPLASKKLKYNECNKILLEKITKLVIHWSPRFLSHGGMLALINSVLSSIKSLLGVVVHFF